MINLYTIGFQGKSAREFFEGLKKFEVKCLFDIRHEKDNPCAGMMSKSDFRYILKQICGINYMALPIFAPTEGLVERLQNGSITWDEYAEEYRQLLQKRKAVAEYGVKCFDGACFLCSERMPEQCIRRLLVEYMKECSEEEVSIIHIP